MTRVPNTGKRNGRHHSHLRRLARDRKGYNLSSPSATAIASIGPNIWKDRLDAFDHICNTISDSITGTTKADSSTHHANDTGTTKADSSTHHANDAFSGAALLAETIRLFDFLLVSLATNCAALPIAHPPSSQDLRELALTSFRYAQSTHNDATSSSSSSGGGDGKIKTKLENMARKLLRGQCDSPSAFSTPITLAKILEMKGLQVDMAAYLVSLAFRYPFFLGADVSWLAAVATGCAARLSTQKKKYWIRGAQISEHSCQDISLSLLHLARLAAGEVRDSGLRRMFPEASQWVDAHPVPNGPVPILAGAESRKKKEQKDSTVKQDADASRVEEEDLVKQRWLEDPNASRLEEIKLTVKQEPWLAGADASLVDEEDLNVKQEPRLVGANALLVDEQDLNVKQEPICRW
ncbi:hypothetical protein HDU88_005680 [Geranomyces variabilis]|nr:hypothetical protein HDU88_005680 [Geranomyces variabilis]